MTIYSNAVDLQRMNRVQLHPKSVSNIVNSATKGNLDGIAIGIGQTYKEIKEKLGKPDSVGYDMDFYGVYATYKGTMYIFEGDENGKIGDHEPVIGIVAEGKTVGVTSTLKEVKKQIQLPYIEWEDEAYGHGWFLEYKIGMCKLVFQSDEKDGPVKSVWLRD
jgi:hypothetical protein